MIEPRCTKCGKVLRDPKSIARGMGPKCAGVSSSRHTVMVKGGRLGGSAYGLGLSTGVQATLPIVEISPNRLPKRVLAVHNREERRRLFDERKPFQCGLLLPERKAIFYTPTEDDGWKDSTNGRVISHDQLQSYLKRYQFI